MSAEWITLDKELFARAERMLYGIPGGAKKAAARAINRAVIAARQQAVDGVRENYNIRARDVRETLKVSKAKPNRMIAVISSLGAPIPLYKFDVRPRAANARGRTPVRVGVKKGNRETFEKAFIARSGGVPGVYERKGAKRLPIKQLFGPSVPHMLNNDRVVSSIADRAREMLEQRLDHEISRLLDGKND